MAYFAKLGKGNIVTRVTVVNDEVATSEQAGIDFLNQLHKTNDVWKQTWIDGSQRKNYAGTGFTYREDLDGYVAPCNFNSWVLNETTCKWEPPIAYPETQTQGLKDEEDNTINDRYYWNEQKRNWDLI
tara:strand:+ start:92 stop:475 length:384 start_codon:yes stop_codon:yes gene_type:complete